MKKLHILYSTNDRSRYIIRYGEYFKKELVKLPEVEVFFIKQAAYLDDLLKRMPFTPDSIFFDDFAHNYPLYGLQKCAIPKGVLYWDVQRTQQEFRKFVFQNKINLVFSFYRDAFLSFFPEFKAKFRWLPNHVYTPIFKDYGLKKEIDYLLMGALHDSIYPLRTKIAKGMVNEKGFVLHRHPGYCDYSREEENEALVGTAYAKTVNKAKIFFTDDSLYKFPIAKYFEVPACNTLLLASGSAELRDLGFIDGETFVEINEGNYRKKARYYLQHERKCPAWKRNGEEVPFNDNQD
jgi:hypothetical protein